MPRKRTESLKENSTYRYCRPTAIKLEQTTGATVVVEFGPVGPRSQLWFLAREVLFGSRMGTYPTVLSISMDTCYELRMRRLPKIGKSVKPLIRCSWAIGRGTGFSGHPVRSIRSRLLSTSATRPRTVWGTWKENVNEEVLLMVKIFVAKCM
jgi:hypothetical protein